MKIALQHGQIILAEIEPLRYEQLKRMGIFRWNKTTRTMTGPVSLDALNALHNRFTLPDFVETERERLAEVARQVEQQREATEPKPLASIPGQGADVPAPNPGRQYGAAATHLGRQGTA
ncbi:MAG: hypothetical protein ACLTGJ_02255 [Faecalibacterium prausnitzii]